MALGEALFGALLGTFLYLIPAGSLHILIGGLANPHAEGWDITDEARQWKRRYAHGAWWGRRINLLLFGFFLVQVVALLVLATYDCARNTSHLSAAAYQLVNVMHIGFTVGFWALVVLAVAAIPWAGLYLSRARKAEWPDPRRRDYFIVHLVFVPLALLLLNVAFGVAHRLACPS